VLFQLLAELLDDLTRLISLDKAKGLLSFLANPDIF